MLVYAGVLAYACTLEPDLAVLIGGMGGIGGAMLVWVLTRSFRELLPWTVVCLGGAYGVGVIVRGDAVDGAAPLVGAGLLLCAELASWSLDERHRIAAERLVVVNRAAAVAALMVASIVAGALVLSLAAVPGAGGGFAWTLAGAAAAVLAVWITVRLARG